MNDIITVSHGTESISLDRANYPDAASILNSSLVKQQLRFPEGAVLKDEVDTVISGQILPHQTDLTISRQAGGKNR